MFDVISINDMNDERVTWVVGKSGVIFYANKIAECKTYEETLEVLYERGLKTSKNCILV